MVVALAGAGRSLASHGLAGILGAFGNIIDTADVYRTGASEGLIGREPSRIDRSRSVAHCGFPEA